MEKHSEEFGQTLVDGGEAHEETAGGKQDTGANTHMDSHSDHSQMADTLQIPPAMSAAERTSGNIAVEDTSHNDHRQSSGGQDQPNGDDGIICPDGDSDLEEPKMCNEKTATYWTGGGGESHEDLPSDSEDHNMAAQRNFKENSDRPYFPLHKTLQNLRLLDLKLKYNNRQATGDKRSADTSDPSSSSDEGDSGSPEHTEQGNNPLCTETTHSLGLITLLSQCHLKLQQMEELRLYSAQLARSLWEAHEMISYLKENVAALHRENAQNENAIFSLSKELMEAKSLLCEKSERIADMEAVFSGLGDQLQSRPLQQRLEQICQMHARDPSASGICAIL